MNDQVVRPVKGHCGLRTDGGGTDGRAQIHRILDRSIWTDEQRNPMNRHAAVAHVALMRNHEIVRAVESHARSPDGSLARRAVRAHQRRYEVPGGTEAVRLTIHGETAQLARCG